MSPRLYWFFWFFAVVVVSAFAHQQRRATGLTDEKIIITAGFSLAGVVALLKVLMNVSVHYQALEELLDWDGITALTISCLLGMVIALKEIIKLIKP